MKKKVLSCFMAVFMLLSVGCGDLSSSQQDSPKTGEYTQKVEYENVSFYLPDDAQEIAESENEYYKNQKSIYPKYKAYKVGFGEIRITPAERSVSAKNSFGWDFDNEKLVEDYKSRYDKSYQKVEIVKIGDEKGVYIESRIDNKKDPRNDWNYVRLVFCSTDTVIDVEIIGGKKRIEEESKKFLNHITIDSSKNRIELKAYAAFKSAVSLTKIPDNDTYYKMTDLSAPDPSSNIERDFIEKLKSKGIDKGVIYGYYVVTDGQLDRDGICYAESKDSTDLKFYPKEFEDKWKKDGRKFSEFCEAIDAVAAVAKALAEEKAERVRLTGTSDVALQEVILSKPTVFYKEGPADAFGQKEITYILAYDLKNSLEKSKAQSWTEGRACTGQLGLCLAKEYTDGHWEKSDDSGYDYMYKSDSFRRIYGDYLYVSLYGTASGGYYTNIAFGSHVPMINFLEDLKLI